MIGFIKNVLGFLTEELSIHISPKSPAKSMKNFKMRRIYPIIAVIIVVVTIFSLGFLYRNYQNKYQVVNNKLEELEGVYKENKQLEEELLTLSRETEKLKQSLKELKEYNNSINSMIAENSKKSSSKNKEKEKLENIELRTAVSYNYQILEQGIPRGGGDLRLLYQDTNEMIKTMQKNINMVKNEIPKQKQELEKLEKNVKKHNQKLAATPKIWPVKDSGDGYISSNFGWRDDPTTSEREFHEGLDIAVWYNTPVLATAYGKVSYTGWENGFGWVVKIEHGFGFKTIYGHLNHIEVEEGEKVKRGEKIALTGNSGRSTGPHLHYEIRVNGSPKNPRKFIGR